MNENFRKRFDHQRRCFLSDLFFTFISYKERFSLYISMNYAACVLPYESLKVFWVPLSTSIIKIRREKHSAFVHYFICLRRLNAIGFYWLYECGKAFLQINSINNEHIFCTVSFVRCKHVIRAMIKPFYIWLPEIISGLLYPFDL